jgi:mono/diheme cytochrome c family protein
MDKSEIKAIRVGALQSKGDKQTLLATLERQQLAAFTLDAIAVTKAGATVQKGGLLFGSPGLLQRLYYNNRFSNVASISLSTEEKLAKTSAFEFLLPKPAQAANSLVGADLNALIARGQQLFTEETFAGNGRTCATCHRPDNNHTIDPQYIAKLPRKDPLFVAEYNPELVNLEKPALLRQFGLFVANVDGFDKPAVMRSAQHLLGLASSLTFETSAMGGEFVEDDSYFNDHDIIAQATSQHTQAIGWSGDGAPDGGSLRDFAKGAIKQHLPKTLNRVENSDFRMPTEDELDALEAYMLSLGRTTDINLAAMTFKSPLVERGLQLFNTKNNPGETVANGAVTGTPVFGTSANCNGCHMNTGAISSTTGGNPTRDTGVERMRDQLHRLVDSSVAFDGGFGQVQQQDCGPNFDQTCYSDGSVDPRGVRPADHPRLNRFNTPSLVEAADTGPFFHNNSVTTLEEAVAFYNTEAFNNSPGAFTSKGINRQVKLDSSQVIAVALFLRTINVLENIRSSSQLDQEAINQTGNAYDRTVHLAEEDTKDAVDVFTDAVVNPYPAATTKLKMALQYEQKAKSGFTLSAQRISYLQKAIALKAEARNMIVSGG